MMDLYKYVQDLSEEDLKACFKEITDYKNKGILPLETRVRKVTRDYNVSKQIPLSWDEDSTVTTEAILYEIARRYMDNSKN